MTRCFLNAFNFNLYAVDGEGMCLASSAVAARI